MKYIIAIIQPHKFEEVKKELENVEVHLITVSNVLGRGRQKGFSEVYRGVEEIGLLKKIKLEIAVNEDFLEPTVAAITKGAHTGHPGDGKIFVCDLHEVVRIGTGERGGKAIG
ncbi:MAG: P-II family nitrogen regulator [Deltaproteobacteria bacterium]|nr:P-II family nitrogen regulator [Deltaproteobacteria bacterium]